MPETSPPSAAEADKAPGLLGSGFLGSSPRQPPYPGLVGELARDGMARSLQRARDIVYGSALYRLTLRGPLPDKLAVTPELMTHPTLAGAQDILRGRFSLASGTIEVLDRSPFDIEVEPELKADLHRFGWLAHLEKAGGKTAHFVARSLVEDWLDRFRRYTPYVWRPDILGPRLVAWAGHLRFLTSTNDLVYRSRLMRALAEQTRHLARSVDEAPPGPGHLQAAASLVTMSLALPEGLSRTHRALEVMRRAAAGAMLPDGGIVTRSARDQAGMVALLITTERALADAQIPKPAFLASLMETSRDALSMMRHGDGRLACFNGADEGDETWLGDLMGGTPPPDTPRFAPSWGYGRIAASSSVLMLDCGGPPPGAQSAAAHAGPLAFEFSRGETRIVVNGGVAWRRGGDWPAAARRTAAHATLQIGEADAGYVLRRIAAPRLGARLYGGTVGGNMQAAPGGLWVEGSHDLYLARFGVTHQRRLFMDPSGEDLRGEDRLIRLTNKGRLDIAIRFPLHPDCKATIAQGGDSVLIAPPSSEAWRFRTSLSSADQRLVLEPSVYMGGEVVRKSQSIVLYATPLGNDWTVRWAIKLENPYRRSSRRLV